MLLRSMVFASSIIAMGYALPAFAVSSNNTGSGTCFAACTATKTICRPGNKKDCAKAIAKLQAQLGPKPAPGRPPAGGGGGNPVPLPAGLWLMGSAIAGLAVAQKYRRNKK